LLKGGVYALKTSFQFLPEKTAVLAFRFCVAVCRFWRVAAGGALPQAGFTGLHGACADTGVA